MTASDFRDIERLLSDFAWFADRGDGAGLAKLFLDDAVLHVGGEEHRGRVSIAADCDRRAKDPKRTVRHVWSNLRVDRKSEDRIAATAVQLTFEQKGSNPTTQLRVNDLQDEFARGPDGIWRFARRVIHRAMALEI